MDTGGLLQCACAAAAGLGDVCLPHHVPYLFHLPPSPHHWPRGPYQRRLELLGKFQAEPNSSVALANNAYSKTNQLKPDHSRVIQTFTRNSLGCFQHHWVCMDLRKAPFRLAVFDNVATAAAAVAWQMKISDRRLLIVVTHVSVSLPAEPKQGFAQLHCVPAHLFTSSLVGRAVSLPLPRER